jgi:hypothetical protein
MHEFEVRSHSNTFYDWDIFLDNRDSYFTDHGFGSEMKAKKTAEKVERFFKNDKDQNLSQSKSLSTLSLSCHFLFSIRNLFQSTKLSLF